MNFSGEQRNFAPSMEYLNGRRGKASADQRVRDKINFFNLYV